LPSSLVSGHGQDEPEQDINSLTAYQRIFEGRRKALKWRTCTNPLPLPIMSADNNTSAPVPKSGFILWLTGLPASGKTTIARGLEKDLRERGCRVEVLDGDEVRRSLSKGLGYSRQDRDTNIRRLGFVANLLSRNGVVAIVAAISPYRDSRNEMRATTHNFIEVYVNAPLEVCEARDPKGLYAMARAGEVIAFTGIDDPYEAPTAPDIVCPTHEETPAESINRVIDELHLRNLIPEKPQLEFFI
jgi:adenylylsulfate kinase